MSYAWMEGPQDSHERYVYLCIADCANQDGHAFPSLPTISERTCLSESTVRRAIGNLEKGGWLTVFRGNGKGKYSQYQLQRVSEGKLSDSNSKGVTVQSKGVTQQKPPYPLKGVTVKNRQLTFRAYARSRDKPSPPNPGAQGTEEPSEEERYEIWLSTSAKFRKENPWQP